MHSVTVVVPFYSNPELVDSLFDSIDRCLPDLESVNCSVVAVNDSPGNDPLRQALRRAQDRLSGRISLTVLENDVNTGFVKSINRGIAFATQRNSDVLLLNAETLLFPGAVTEIQAVAYLDPMIGFVSPRSNNGIMCSFPPQEQFQCLEPEQAWATFRDLSPYLPRFRYVPTAVGSCMYIKDCVLSEFGTLDETFDQEYTAENDLVMRANRAGFRAALANHAFVYHIGEASLSISEVRKSVHEEKTAALLTSRYPEYLDKVQEYFTGPQYRTDVLARGLMKDYAGRRSVVFDFSTLGAYHNGTFEAARHLLVRAAESWLDDFQIHVIASEECARFHRLFDIPNILIEPVDTTRIFSAAVRFGQPFKWSVITRMAALAPVNIYGMLDTIAWDCLYLNELGNLDAMWRFVFQHADGVFYISHFAERQFQTRFRMHPRLKQCVCYLSLDPDDYGRPTKGTEGPGHILVLGNSFAHKRVPETVQALSRAFPDRSIVAIGADDLSGQNIVCYPSGYLTDAFMNGLYAGASVIVFPSIYEGFGIPIMKALAFRKPLLARNIPVTAELHERLGLTPNIIRYSSTTDLIRLLRERPPEWVDTPLSSQQPTCSWSVTASQLRDFVLRNIEGASLTDRVEPRLQALHDMRTEVEKALAATQARVAEVDTSSARTTNELRIALADRDARVKSLEQSLSWSVTAPLRAAGRIWLRLFG